MVVATIAPSARQLTIPSCHITFRSAVCLCLTLVAVLTLHTTTTLLRPHALTRLAFAVDAPFAQPHPNTVSSHALLTALAQRNARFKVKGDRVVYDRYARVYSRDIRFPNGRTFSFDIWGRVWRNDSFTVVAIVPFDRRTQTVTLIREYNPAHARYVYSFPQGVVEPGKHADTMAAAVAELEEEAHLRCSNWSPLFAADSLGVPQDKYQREVVFFYLCSEAVDATNAAHVDDEEDIEIVGGVTIDQLHDLFHAGAMQSNNIAAGLLALNRLRIMNLIAEI